MAAGTGDRDVEEAAFLLDVVGQAVRILFGVGQMHDHVRPLLALDPVHRGQQHATGRPLDGELAAHPTLERGGIVVQRREVGDRSEIVALGRPVHAAPVGVERRNRARQTDVVDQREHEVRGTGARSDELLQPLDVGGEVDHTLGVAFVGEASGELVEIDDRRLFADPVGDARVERT